MKKLHWPKNKKVWVAIGALLVAALVAFLCIWQQVNQPGTDPTDPSATQSTQKDPLLPDFIGMAKAIKNNLVLALQDMKQSNWDGAREKLLAVQKDIATVRSFADKLPFLIDLIPQAKSLYDLLCAVDMALPDVLLPAVDLLESRPLSALSVGDGFDVTLLHDYISFAESVMPKLEQLLAAANAADLSILDSEGKITQALESVNQLMEGYREHPQILPMLKTILGEQEDRFYLIAVQNPSEIRASGGFPGFMGTLRIENGILTLGDFESVVKFLAAKKPNNIQITKEETALFNYLSTMNIPRDADLCPDFVRVAHIWASSYEEWRKQEVAGIISITPHLVQRLLAATGTEIALSDGWVLNGENALRVLIHDIYFKYFDRRYPHPDRLKLSDQLFAEAAEQTMKVLTGDISADKLLAYLPVLKESIADRTLMLWLKDEQEQSFVVDMGWHGGLNTDPQKPEAGVYVNVVSASKMGWFLLMDTQIGQRTQNADGSYTYPITVTFSNNVTEEEIRAASTYISGGLAGAMRAVAYFFAPAGGTVDHFTASNGKTIHIMPYNGMTLGFTGDFLVKPNEEITITYTVTTAPGVETPLVFSKTPTAQ